MNTESINGIALADIWRIVAEQYPNTCKKIVIDPTLDRNAYARADGTIHILPRLDIRDVEEHMSDVAPDVKITPINSVLYVVLHEVAHYVRGDVERDATDSEIRAARSFLAKLPKIRKQFLKKRDRESQPKATAWAISEFARLVGEGVIDSEGKPFNQKRGGLVMAIDHTEPDLTPEEALEITPIKAKMQELEKRKQEIDQQMSEIQAEANKEAAEKARKEREAREIQEEKEIQEALSAETRLAVVRGKRDTLQKEIGKLETVQAQRQKQVLEGKRREALRQMEEKMTPLYRRLVQLNNVEIPTLLNRCYEELERVAGELDEMRAEETDLAAKLRGMEGELVKYGGTLASIHNAAVKASAAEGGPVDISKDMYHLMHLIGTGGQATAWLWATESAPVTRVFNPQYGRYRKSPSELLQLTQPIYRRKQPANVPSRVTLPGLK